MEKAYWERLDGSEREFIAECWRGYAECMAAVRGLLDAVGEAPFELSGEGAGAAAEAYAAAQESRLGGAVLASPDDPAPYFEERAAAEEAGRGRPLADPEGLGVVGMHVSVEAREMTESLEEGVRRTWGALNSVLPVIDAAKAAADVCRRH